MSITYVVADPYTGIYVHTTNHLNYKIIQKYTKGFYTIYPQSQMDKYYRKNNFALCVNECGAFNGMECNNCTEHIVLGDIVYGPCVITKMDENDEDHVTLTDDDIKLLKEY